MCIRDSHGTTAALQGLFLTGTTGASACVCVRVRVCACILQQYPGVYRNQEQSQEERCNFSFSSHFLFCYCLLLCTASHRVLLTLRQPSYISTQPYFKQGVPFVTGINGAPECACLLSMPACHPEHNQWTIPTHTSSEFEKHPPRSASAEVHNTSKPHTMAHTHMGTPGSPLSTCETPRDVKSTTSRRGTLSYTWYSGIPGTSTRDII